MSYYQQPGGYAPPPSHSPQPGYYPPANQPPPQSHSPYQMYNQQQPPYPPQQQQWGQPPPGQGQYGQQPPYNQPPQQQWGQQPPQQPPQQHWGQQPPPNQQWGHAPPPQGNYTHSPAPPVQQPGGWGAPPAGGQYQQPPHQGQHGAQVRPPKSTFGHLKSGVQALTAELKQPHGAGHFGEPTAPRGADPNSDAIRIHKAIAGLGTDDRELVLTLAAVGNPSQMAYLRQTYDRMFAHEHTVGGGRKDFLKAIEGDVSGDYGELCTTLARTQAESDAYFVNKAINRPGTSEDLLNDVLLGRTNYDIYQMKQSYRQIYGKDMIAAVGGDLSMKTKDLFMLILDDRRPRPEENAPCIPQEIERDAAELKSAMRSSFGSKDTNAVMNILGKRSNGQIRAINQKYNSMYGNLEKDIKKKFSGHMEDAMLLMLKRGIDPIKAEADQLEHSMKGIGTNEAVLTNRVVNVHWDKPHADQVKMAYKQLHHKSLIDRIRGETSGWYEKLLVELMYPGVLENPGAERDYKKRGQ
ncbi:Annexin [Rhizodiscina lignyota]|uniref:Annexin n=1 Tax=Rhizodiscina lignyota TaxID=1504668 RepID=A0A9P4IN65_9PEZI|nr:Annexin [Rhizodiscina lignyota]